jgi:hypothetical protein
VIGRAIVPARSCSVDSRGQFRKRSHREPSCSEGELVSRGDADSDRAAPVGPTVSQAKSCSPAQGLPAIR